MPTRVLRASASTLTLGLGFPSNRSRLGNDVVNDFPTLIIFAIDIAADVHRDSGVR